MAKDKPSFIELLNKIEGVTFFNMGDKKKENLSVKVVETDNIFLNKALGVGGWPLGRLIELYGHESTGKTTLALYAIAAFQKAGYSTSFMDAEYAFNSKYAELLGVDTKKLLIGQPECGEDALDAVELIAKTEGPKLIVVDSIAALVPRAEMEGQMDDLQVGAMARMMGKGLRKLAPVCGKTDTTVIFLNQIRHKIGGYGNPEVTTGGMALRFYASLRLEIRRIALLKKEEKIIGGRTRVKVIKNKLAIPYQEFEYDFIAGKGWDLIGCILDAAAQYKIVDRSGAWYSYGTERIGQGRQKAIQFLEDNSEKYNEIKDLVVEKVNGE